MQPHLEYLLLLLHLEYLLLLLHRNGQGDRSERLTTRLDVSAQV